MDILGDFFRNLLSFLAALEPTISMFIIRLGLWFVISYAFALLIFGAITENRMLENLAPFLVFGLATMVAFPMPLTWVHSGSVLVGYLNLFCLCAIVALPREIPKMVFRRFGYQIMTAKFFYGCSVILALVQLAFAKGG